MKLVMLLLSLMLLLIAAAIELWWGSAARQRRRQNLAHIEQKLHGKAGASGLPPALPENRHEPTARMRMVTNFLLRADLKPGWPIVLALGAPGILLAAVVALRIGSLWAIPFALAVYAVALGLWLHSRKEKLQRQIVRQLPDFLDGMVRLTSIGNSLPMAFQATSTQVPMPLRTVLDRALMSVRAGMDLDRALQLAVQPYRIDALELLHVVLGTGMRLGGRADVILQRVSDFMRDLAQAQQELKAITSETRMSAWVLGLLPIGVAGIMSLTNPSFFTPMFEQPLGHSVLLVALALEVIGVALLYRLAKSL